MFALGFAIPVTPRHNLLFGPRASMSVDRNGSRRDPCFVDTVCPSAPSLRGVKGHLPRATCRAPRYRPALWAGILEDTTQASTTIAL